MMREYRNKEPPKLFLASELILKVRSCKVEVSTVLENVVFFSKSLFITLHYISVVSVLRHLDRKIQTVTLTTENAQH